MTSTQALMAAVGFGNTAGEVVEKGAPYLVRGAADLVPTSALLDEYSPECCSAPSAITTTSNRRSPQFGGGRPATR